MRTLKSDFAKGFFEQIEKYKPEVHAVEVGEVLEVGDGIARVSGLPSVQASELVEFATGTLGIAFNLEADNVGVIIMGEYADIAEGSEVRRTGRIASVPVGPAIVGRVLSALGEPIDGRGPIQSSEFRYIERIAPGVIERQDVDTPVQTGIVAIDAMTPIGRGQRELIIGDRQTGKTAVALDTIINQKGQNMTCIYVAIGQKASSIKNVVRALEANGAMDYTIVVAASASESAAMQYVSPYSGCTMGEYFRDRGQD